MIDATNVMTWYHKNWPIQVRRYEVDATTTEMIRLEIPGPQEEFETHWERVRCMIRGLIVACDSTDFDVHLFNKANASIDSVNQIMKVEGNNKWMYEDQLTLPFVNRDEPQDEYIYMRIVGGSGIAYIDLMVT